MRRRLGLPHEAVHENFSSKALSLIYPLYESEMEGLGDQHSGERWLSFGSSLFVHPSCLSHLSLYNFRLHHVLRAFYAYNDIQHVLYKLSASLEIQSLSVFLLCHLFQKDFIE